MEESKEEYMDYLNQKKETRLSNNQEGEKSWPIKSRKKIKGNKLKSREKKCLLIK